ncbi:protein kinase [Streptomyces sp. NPDC050658]|uniref:protein kinase domain-containing protein n=1 Tax=unclassified Streptomyces TaxID=2593676 RepID=UPI00342F9E80
MAASPERFGCWTTGPLLGQGAMGRVHVAHDGAGRTVALKVVHRFLAGDEEFRARFARETAALGAVRGPWTAALVDADPAAALPWLATEYVPGPTLAARVRDDGPLPVAELRALAGALAGALSSIHRAGLVHRDLKPSNVLLSPAGPRVIDFGIARAADGTGLTASGAAPGTAGYAAPEHLTQGVSTPAADVFSLGAVLAFAATGRAPFGGGAADAVGYRTVHAEPDLVGVPEELLPLITACLAKNPAARPAPRTVARMAGLPLPGSRRRAFTVAGTLLAVAGLITGLLLVPGGEGGTADATGSSGGGLPEGDEVPQRPGKVTERLGAREMRDLGDPASPLGNVPMEGDWSEEWARRPKEPAAGEGSNRPKDRQQLIGVWLTDQALIRANEDAVRAFDPATGDVLWTAKPPKPGLKPCAMARTADEEGRRGAVVFGPDPDFKRGCDQLAVLDLGSGRTTWTKSLTVRNPPAPRAWTRVGIAGGNVVVLTAADEAAYAVDDGERRWRRPYFAGGCVLQTGLVGRETVVESATCGEGKERRERVREIDARDGSVRWVTELPKDVTGITPATAEPVSAMLFVEDSKDLPLQTFDAEGRPGKPLSDKQPFGTVTTSGFGSAYDGPKGWRDLVVTEYYNKRGFGVLAVDAATGKVRWRHPYADTTSSMVLGADDRGVLVAEGDDGYGRTVRLKRLDLDDGDVSSGGAIGDTRDFGSGATVFVRDGRAVVFSILDEDEGPIVLGNPGGAP